MPHAQLNSIEALKVWWNNLSEKHSYWTLYMGHSRNKSAAATIGANTTEGDREEALIMLVSAIENQSSQGGRFTILAKEKNTGNYGVTTYLTIDKPGVAGIGGMQGMNPGLGVIGNPSLQNYIAGEKEKAVETALMRKEIEELKQQQEVANAPTTFFGEMRAMMTDDPEGFNSMMGGVFTAISGFIAVLPKSAPPPAPQAQTQYQEPTPADNGLTPEAVTAFDEIHRKYDLNNIMPNLEKYLEDNPEIADQLTNS